MGVHRSLRHAVFALIAAAPLCAACASADVTTPRPTAAAIILITPAPTLQIDATATAYAQQLIPSPTPAGLYVVQRGDTLSAIATQFGTTVADLMAANGLTDPDAIQAGQSILIPSLLPGTPVRGTLPPLVTSSVTPTPSATPRPTVSTP